VGRLVDEERDDLEGLVLVDVPGVVAETQVELGTVPEPEDVPLFVVLAEQSAVRTAEVLVVRPGEEHDAPLKLLFELGQRAAGTW
jgi:hypothetical protein